MGLFKKNSGSVPDRAASPSRRPVSSASDWMTKSPVNTPATQQAEAVDKWKSNNAKAQNSDILGSMYSGIDKNVAERRNQKSSGGFVTSEGDRAIDTGRM